MYRTIDWKNVSAVARCLTMHRFKTQLGLLLLPPKGVTEEFAWWDPCLTVLGTPCTTVCIPPEWGRPDLSVINICFQCESANQALKMSWVFLGRLKNWHDLDHRESPLKLGGGWLTIASGKLYSRARTEEASLSISRYWGVFPMGHKFPYADVVKWWQGHQSLHLHFCPPGSLNKQTPWTL